jgi:hypothetical protein
VKLEFALILVQKLVWSPIFFLSTCTTDATFSLL